MRQAGMGSSTRDGLIPLSWPWLSPFQKPFSLNREQLCGPPRGLRQRLRGLHQYWGGPLSTMQLLLTAQEDVKRDPIQPKGDGQCQ